MVPTGHIFACYRIKLVPPAILRNWGVSRTFFATRTDRHDRRYLLSVWMVNTASKFWRIEILFLYTVHLFYRFVKWENLSSGHSIIGAAVRGKQKILGLSSRPFVDLDNRKFCCWFITHLLHRCAECLVMGGRVNSLPESIVLCFRVICLCAFMKSCDKY